MVLYRGDQPERQLCHPVAVSLPVTSVSWQQRAAQCHFPPAVSPGTAELQVRTPLPGACKSPEEMTSRIELLWTALKGLGRQCWETRGMSQMPWKSVISEIHNMRATFAVAEKDTWMLCDVQVRRRCDHATQSQATKNHLLVQLSFVL